MFAALVFLKTPALADCMEFESRIGIARALAHDDKSGPKLDQPLNYKDIDVAIQAVENVAKKYLALLSGASWITLTPIDLTGAVQVFRIPWISD